jgi:hypothetical protein
MSKHLHFDESRERFGRMHQETRARGLDPALIEQALIKCRWEDGVIWLGEEAYLPTGLALGCPLPQPAAVSQLWEMACAVDRWLRAATASYNVGLAFVPCHWYHITLLSRSHYSDGRRLTYLTKEEAAQAAITIRELGIEMLSIVLSGLSISRSGALLVGAFPTNGSLEKVRLAAAQSNPLLQNRFPAMTYVKIAQLPCRLDDDVFSELAASFVNQYDALHLELCFQHVYTPAGFLSFR